MFPVPGSRTASAQTTISLRGANAAQAKALRVVGSVTGAHTGTVRAHSDGAGVSFVPDSLFHAGETVTVSGTSEVRGANNGTARFEIGIPASETTPPSSPSSNPPSPRVTAFESDPSVQAPVFTVTTRKSRAAGGLVALAAKGAGLPGQLGLFRSDGSLVWRRAAPSGLTANDFKRQTYAGAPVLTWWQGKHFAHGYGEGEHVLLGSDYRQVALVRAGNGYSADMHDFQLTESASALLTVYAAIRWDLRPYGGKSNGIVLDSIVQEVDVETGLVLFEWHALDHVAPEMSYVDAPQDATSAWDFFHVNSIDASQDGALLLSARHTSALSNVDRSTGDVLWTLGGKRSDFTTIGAAAFFFQHDARWQQDGSITLFDDEGGPPRRAAVARGLRLNVDPFAKRVSVSRAYPHASGIVTNSQGNVQQLDTGGLFVGWGDQPAATEFDAGGAVVWDATLATGVSSYRAFRVDWTGSPRTPPKAALVSRGTRRVAYASWNGDTRTHSWRLVGTNAAGAVGTVLGVAAGGSFEAAITVPGGASALRMQALDTEGTVLAAVSVS